MSHFDGFQPLNISTHALREEGDPPGQRQRRGLLISTHALREEGDMVNPLSLMCSTVFLPTPSARRATAVTAAENAGRMISTHALREEGDRGADRGFTIRYGFLPTPSARRATPSSDGCGARDADFYPRPPRGGRRTFFWL